MPSRSFQSAGLTAAASTLIKASPWPGLGTGISSATTASGPPNRLTRIAVMVFMTGG
jgi:hypothetical protein